MPERRVFGPAVVRPSAVNRAERITVRWSSDPAQPFAEWTLLTTPWAFTNGVLSAELPVVRTGPPRFYIATE